MMRIIAGILFCILICEPLILQADQPLRQSLFTIERSKNANIVQYDAQIGPDGKLDPKKPVVVYWVRLAEQGQIQELSWVQRTFAYGFKADLDRASDSLTLDMVANFGRLIRVKNENGVYRATMDIDGKPSRIVKIFIHGAGKGLSTKVEFAELYGTEVDSGAETYERFVP